MKIIKKILLLFAVAAFLFSNATAQQLPTNATLGIQTLGNAGQVFQGSVIDVQIQVSNNGSNPILGNKVRTQLSLPIAIVSALSNAQQTGLPPGWIITSNTGGVITICNGSDIIPPSVTRTALIKIQGNTIGGPSIIQANLQFGPGTAVCTGLGTLPGDLPADNGSTSTVQVLPAPACNLAVTAAAGTILCNGGTTTLTATPAGNNGAVEYSITGGAPFQLSNVFNVPAGTYTVLAREVNNPSCTATTTSVTVSQPTAITASATATAVTTVGGTNGTATVVATGGTAPYTYLWNPSGQTTATATGLSAGSYTVTVTDANGCTATATATVDAPTCAITVTASSGTILCNGGTTSLTATATGGVGTLEYSLNGGAYQTSNVFTVPAGTYTVTVREVANPTCNATSTSVTVSQPTQLVAASTAGSILCFGGTATVTVSATGGTAPYTGTGTFTVSTGAYSYTVTDANGCTSVTTGTVSQPTAITANATATPVTTIGGTNGTATVTATGGTAPYTYLWNPSGQTTAAATGLTAGSYTVTVTDANGCTATATATVGSPACNVTLSFIQTNVSCFGTSTGTATVTASNTTGTVTYLWSNGQTTATATGLAAGTYTVTVTDGAGCTANGSVTISQPTALVAASTASNILCFGGTTTVTVSATGGTAPYTGTGTFTVSAGTYSYTVTDANGCTSVTTGTISQPATALAATSVVGAAILCNGGTTTVTVNATGGTAPYTGTGTFTRGAGTYSYTVTDANGCTAITTGTITQPTGLFVTSAAPAIVLPGGSTTVSVTAAGGTPPYAGTGNFVRTAGTYTFTVTDANGCVGTTTITLSNPVAGPTNASINIQALSAGQVLLGQTVDLQVDITNTGLSFIGVNKVRAQISIPVAIASAVSNAQQLGLPAGWIIVSNTGGVITICNGTDIIPASTTRTALIKIQGTAVGGPSIINGQLSFGPGTGVCTGLGTLPGDLPADNSSTSSIQVLSNCNLALTATAGTILCNGGTTSLTATATGGVGTLEYSLNGGAYQTSNVFTVPVGTYTVTVREVANPTCNATSTSVTVSQPTQLVAASTAGSILCFGGTATVTVSATGGTAPYTGTGTFTVSTGAYSYTVTDANGCTSVTTGTVSQPTAITANATATPVTTIGGTNGTATVTATGGTAPYTYLWNPSGQTTAAATGLTAGSYTVTVTDANGCTATATATVGSPNCNVLLSFTKTDVSCPSASTGTATVTASNTTGTVTYLWSNGQTTATATGLAAGTYTVTVTDGAGCTANGSVTISTNPDITKPTITAPSSVTVCTNSGCTATGVLLGTPVTADNCTVASVTNNAPTAFSLGTTTISWTVTDGSGNTATATQVITVNDCTAPSIYLNQSGLLAGTTGPSSSASPYMVAQKPGVKFKSILSVGDNIGGYQMVGIPDGLGAFDNNNGTFTLLMNHELGSGAGGIRAHGAIGAFVSKWVINKTTLQVQSGSDLMQQVYNWNIGSQSNNASTSTLTFNRFCSADLPSVSAFYNGVTGLGTKSRIFMHGEEGGANGWQMGTVANGPDAGKSYVLGKFNLTTNGSGLIGVGGWENALANPFEQNKTIVIGLNDGGTGIMNNSLAVYVGTKTNSGSEVDKAGLNNGTLSFVNVTGNATEIVNTATRATNIVSGAPFTLSSTSSTTFSRPEDGLWNPTNPSQFFFVTTDQYDQVKDGIGAQVGRSRLWRLNFTDITNPAVGGTIDLLLDGTEAGNMFDNMGADKFGNLILQEDVGNQQHNGKIWQYKIATDQLTLLAKHDPARFGDVGQAATAPFNQDEETSGIIDIADILGNGNHLLVDQTHYALPSPLVEGGQLLAMFNPESVGATSTANDTLRVCSGTGVNLGTPATSDNCSVASVTNNAPNTFPVGTTNVTWTVTDGSGNIATATQVVIVSDLAATSTATTIACNGGNSTVTISATGGTAPYTGTGTFTRTAGTYSFTVTDANGCTAVTNITIAQPTALIATVTSTPVTTIGGSNGTASVVAAGGSAPYSYLWSPGGQTTATANGLTAGSYTVTITDANGCTTTATTTVGSPACNLTVTIAKTNVLCFGGSTGTATATAANATGSVTYLWSNGQTSQTATGLAAGTYNVSVTDGAGCTSTSSVVISQPTAALAATSTATAIACNGGSSTVTVSATGGTAPYTGTGTFTRTAGTYSFTVTDANGCTAVTTVTIVEPTAIVATSTATAISCNGGNSTVTVSATGGTAPYTGTGTFTRTAGTYNFTVTDANGCTAITTITIAQPTPLVTTLTATPILCNGGTSTITSTTIGGTPGYEYTITGSNGYSSDNTNGIFAGLTAATYTVTGYDQGNCTSVAIITITEPSLLVVSSTATAISCNGGNSTVTVSAIGGTAPYTGTGTFTRTAGTYSFTVTDANGCTKVTSVTITEPTAIVATSTATAILCNGGSSTVTVSATGGTAPYTGTGSFTRTAGTYSFTITDAKGCTAITTVTIAQPSAITATATSTPVSTIGASNGTATVVAIGGTAPYTYLWTPSGQTTATATGLTAGSYSVRITDANGCIKNATVTVGAPECSLIASASATAILCNGGNSTVTVSATGGVAPYTGTGTFIVSAGTYTYTVTDAVGCVKITTITISQPSALVVSSTATAISCNGGNSTVTVSATGGTAPYTGTGTFTRTAGTYSFTVTDTNGCTAITSVTIAQPTAIVATSTATAIACNGGSSTVTVSAIGGTAPYSGTGTFTRTAGTYSFTVTDAKGCTAVTTVTIAQPALLVASSAATAISCNGGNSTVTVSATGGTSPYTGTGTFTRTAGTYSFTVTDANGCTAVTTVTIAQPTLLTATATSTPVTTVGGTNGTATVVATGGTSPYTYLWSPSGQTTATATGLAAGTYTVTVTDAKGCSATATTTIGTNNNNCNLVVNAGLDAVLCNNTSSVTLTAGVSGVSAGVTPATPFTEVSGSTADMRLFSGNIDEITIGNTFSLGEDRNNCGKLTSSSKTLTIPTGAVVKKAYLYWSGSGNLDNSVSLNGTSVIADGTKTATRSGGFSYFAARKDVTSLVSTSGNYTVTNLDWNNSNLYCYDNSAYGAWAMTVIYEQASLPSARIHVNTEKFVFTYPGGTYSSDINNISVPAGCNANAKLTIVAFEGDSYKTEKLRIAGVLDVSTPTNNNFRGQSGFNLDIVTKNAPSVVPGTTSLNYSIETYAQSTPFGTAVEGLFDYAKVLKYNYCVTPICNVGYVWKKNGVTVGTTQSISVNAPGTYQVTATDCKGCIAIDEVVVSTSTLAATAIVGAPISCYGGTTTVTVAATGGTAPYTGTGTFNKGCGTWTFTVTDAKGCSRDVTVTVTQPTQLVVSASAPQIVCGQTTANVIVSATGGTAPYTGTGTFAKAAGTYTFAVTDAKGCSASCTVTVTAAPCGPVNPAYCYKLVNRNSGKVATVIGNSTANSAQLEQRSYAGTNNQIWKFNQVETGFYSITNLNSGKVLDINASSTADGVIAQQYAYNGGDNQKWSLTPNSSYFIIKAKHSGKAIGVVNSSNSDGAKIEQRGYGSSYNQQWTITQVGCPGSMTKVDNGDIIVNPKLDIAKDMELSVSVRPNPSVDYFTLVINSNDAKTPVLVKILDANSTILSTNKTVSNTNLKVGNPSWTSGTYYAEITQGGQRKVVKLIKL